MPSNDFCNLTAVDQCAYVAALGAFASLCPREHVAPRRADGGSVRIHSLHRRPEPLSAPTGRSFSSGPRYAFRAGISSPKKRSSSNKSPEGPPCSGASSTHRTKPSFFGLIQKFPSFILRDAEEGAEGVRAQHGDERNTPQTPNSMLPNTHTHIELPPSPSRAPLTGAGWGAWGVRALGHTGERLTRLGLGPDASAGDASS